MKNNKIPTLSTLPQYADETEDDNSGTDYSVRYNGKKYKYDETVINLLFIGTDNEDEVKKNEFFGNGGQADVLLLACVNTEKNSVKIISIPRDTLCSVELFDYWGNSLGSKELQIALSYAYGDGEKKSCEITANAVSDLLYGLPVHAWFSMNMQAIPTVNDAIGGVPVTATEENLQFLPSSAKIGDTVLLKGNYARKFIVHRYGANDSERRARQSTYLKSFITAAKKALLSNPLLVVDILNKINDCSVTDLSVDECVWLASELLNMEIDTDFITLKGEEQLVDNQIVYTLDETFLYEMMLDIFYEEVE